MRNQFQAPEALTPKKEPRYPLTTRLRGPQSRYECSGEDRNMLSATEIETRFLGHPDRSLAAIDYAMPSISLSHIHIHYIQDYSK